MISWCLRKNQRQLHGKRIGFRYSINDSEITGDSQAKKKKKSVHKPYTYYKNELQVDHGPNVIHKTRKLLKDNKGENLVTLDLVKTF